MYQDRDRIARDLHDLVIQRLYATGMLLQGTVPMIVSPAAGERVNRAVDAMGANLGGELWLGPAEPGAPRPGTRLEWRVPTATAPAPEVDRRQP